jgi:hypothetical protein
MYHVSVLAKLHGLRDGGSFRDWGHIDDGQPLSRPRYARHNRHTVTLTARREHYSAIRTTRRTERTKIPRCWRRFVRRMSAFGGKADMTFCGAHVCF